jgi:uncharacterized metal-binding protein
MPGGKVHNAITLSATSGVLAPYLIVQFSGNPYWYVAGTLIGLMVTPDLDIDNGNISDTILRKVFPPAQWIWRILWTPYAKLISHRSPISHFPFVGTLFRIGYIFLLLNLFRWLFFLFGNIFSDTVSFIWFWNWSLVLGLCHVDTLHYFADITIKSKEQFENE